MLSCTAYHFRQKCIFDGESQNFRFNTHFWEQTKAFRYEIVFRRIQPFFYRRIVALGLFWTSQDSEDSEEIWGTFCTLRSRNCTFFKKEIFVLIKVSWTFSTFWPRRERKNTKCAFEILFFAMCSADLTCVKGSTIQFLLRELRLSVNLWVFE